MTEEEKIKYDELCQLVKAQEEIIKASNAEMQLFRTTPTSYSILQADNLVHVMAQHGKERSIVATFDCPTYDVGAFAIDMAKLVVGILTNVQKLCK